MTFCPNAPAAKARSAPACSAVVDCAFPDSVMSQCLLLLSGASSDKRHQPVRSDRSLDQCPQPAYLKGALGVDGMFFDSLTAEQ